MMQKIEIGNFIFRLDLFPRLELGCDNCAFSIYVALVPIGNWKISRKIFILMKMFSFLDGYFQKRKGFCIK